MQEAATSTKIRGGAEGKPRDDPSACANGQAARWLSSQGIASSTGSVGVTAPVAAPGHRSGPRAATERSDRWLKRAAVQADAGGYGLQMMRARAAALGGDLVTRRSAQGGVEVEVTFPSRRAGAR